MVLKGELWNLIFHMSDFALIIKKLVSDIIVIYVHQVHCSLLYAVSSMSSFSLLPTSLLNSAMINAGGFLDLLSIFCYLVQKDWQERENGVP